MSEISPLRAYRLAHKPKMPLRTLAERIGVTEGQLSRIERGGTTSLETALRLATATGLPIEAFTRQRAAA